MLPRAKALPPSADLRSALGTPVVEGTPNSHGFSSNRCTYTVVRMHCHGYHPTTICVCLSKLDFKGEVSLKSKMKFTYCSALPNRAKKQPKWKIRKALEYRDSRSCVGLSGLSSPV